MGDAINDSGASTALNDEVRLGESECSSISATTARFGPWKGSSEYRT